MGLVDVAMATAARSVEPELFVVTVELKTTFMAAAGQPLVARGNLLRRTARMAFAEAHVFNSDGSLCIHATGTFRYVPRRT